MKATEGGLLTENRIMRKRLMFHVTGLITLFGALTAAAGNWPGWRGPDGNGLLPGKKLPTEWAANKNIAWKVQLPGAGWSQPIVWGDKVFVTTAVTENQEKPGGSSIRAFRSASLWET
jgi:hypothetical protein